MLAYVLLCNYIFLDLYAVHVKKQIKVVHMFVYPSETYTYLRRLLM